MEIKNRGINPLLHGLILRSLRNSVEQKKVQEVEQDEYSHREGVLKIMRQHEIPVSKFYELKYRIIGRLIVDSL